MKTQILHQHRERETVRTLGTGRYHVSNRSVIKKLLSLNRFEPNTRMQLSSPRGRVVISVQPLGEVLEKQRQGREIVILGKAERVNPKDALTEARILLARSDSRLERRRVTLGVRKKKRIDSDLSLQEERGWQLNKSVGRTTRKADTETIHYSDLIVAIETLRKQVEEFQEKTIQAVRHSSAGGDDIPPAGIFNSVIDENELADCLYSIHSRFFGSKATEKLLNDCDEVRFAAYLFVLVEKEKLGCDNFETRCRAAFFDFMNLKVLPVHNKMEVSHRTFTGRLSEMAELHALPPRQLMAERTSNNFDVRNFQKISEIFRNTPYYLDLKKLKG